MSGSKRQPGDEARVTVLVEVPRAEAFRIFTEEIDAWWRTGMRYRIGRQRSVVHLEAKVGGKLFERFEDEAGTRVVQTGNVLVFEPPSRLVLSWRAVNFAPDERTEVEVTFEPTPSGTRVSVRHSGFGKLRADHPVRHGKEPAKFIGDMGLWWGSLMSALREHAAGRGEASGV
jgi:uncharacterized protein YndB with AHSA1/START domain